MKVLLRTLLVLAPMALSAQTIVGSKHDLTSGAGAHYTGTTQVCIFCHTPHQAAASTSGPLWNHAPSTAGSYTVYASGSMTQVAGQPGAQSSACLSCHDGTVAVGALLTTNTANPTVTFVIGTAPAANWNAGRLTITNPNYVGTDLTNDHPVAIIYPNLGNVGFRTAAQATISGVKLYGTTFQVECASCHMVHNNINGAFLRINNAASALCTACHIK